RVEPALAALFVFHRVVDHRSLAGADTAQGADTLLAAEHLLLDHQALLAILIAHQARRPVAKRRIHVVAPECQGLQDVAIGIYYIVLTSHGTSPILWMSGTLPASPSPAVRDLPGRNDRDPQPGLAKGLHRKGPEARAAAWALAERSARISGRYSAGSERNRST